MVPGTGDRGSLWEEDYTAVGTRPSEDMKGHRSKDVYGMTEGGKGHVELKCSLTETYFEGQTGFRRTCVDLQNDSTSDESQLVAQRRRRELTNIKWRMKTDNPEQVLR